MESTETMSLHKLLDNLTLPLVESFLRDPRLSNSDRNVMSMSIDDIAQFIEQQLVEENNQDSDGSCESDMDLQMTNYEDECE
jgi:hypothetical protein